MGGAQVAAVMRPVTSFPSVWGARPSPWARAPGVPIAIAATAAASFLSGEAKPYGANGHAAARPYGASPTPPELTAAQWTALTPEQQAAFLKADSETKNLIAQGVTAGAKAAVDLILAGIKSADDAANRSNATEIEKIRAANDLAKAKIQAQTQIELARLGQFTPPPIPGGGGGLTASTAAPTSWLTAGGTTATWAAQTDATRAQWMASHEGTVATPAPSTGISGTAVVVGGLAAVGLAWAAFGGKSKGGGGGGGRRRRRRR